MKKIKYILPDFTWYSRNEFFINLIENNSEILREDIEIYSFFGVFPNAIWNGGGTFFETKNTSIKEMKKVRDYYNSKGIAITFTFTNSLITEEHIHDEYCNQMLKIFHNGMNEVLVVSPILERYIRDNYPKYKINRSIINTENGVFISENYNLSVLSKFKNRDFEFLRKLSQKEKKKTELLCNEFCVNDCPYAYQHYKEYAYIQLNGHLPQNCKSDFGTCRFPGKRHEYLCQRIKNSKYWISYEDIINTYVPMGFEYFKLAGRGVFNETTLTFFVDYLIKPEYQMDVRTYLFEEMFFEYKIDQTNKLREIPEYSEFINNSNKNCI